MAEFKIAFNFNSDTEKVSDIKVEKIEVDIFDILASDTKEDAIDLSEQFNFDFNNII